MGAFWGSLAALSIGMSELFGRRTMAGASVLTAAVALQTVATIASIGSLAFVASTFGWADIAWGALSGLGLAVGLGSYFAGLQRSSAVAVAPLVALLAAIIPYSYTLVRGGEASALGIAGAAVAIAGLAVIGVGATDAETLREGLPWGLLSGLGYGFGIAVLVEASDAGGVWPAVAQRGSGTVVLIVAALATHAPLVAPRVQRSNAAMAGIFAGLTSVFALIGLRIDAPPTVLTQSMFPAISVLFGAIYFGDRITKRQVVGIAFVLLGVAAVVST